MSLQISPCSLALRSDRRHTVPPPAPLPGPRAATLFCWSGTSSLVRLRFPALPKLGLSLLAGVTALSLVGSAVILGRPLTPPSLSL